MSTQFAKNEKIFAHYDYATLGYKKKLSKYAVSKSLTVTNKRIIHKEECNKLGKTLLVQKELPLEHARFVDVAMARTIRFAYLVWSLILGALGALVMVFPNKQELLPKVPGFVYMIACGVLGFLALILLICFLCSCTTYLSCTIESDCQKTASLTFASKTTNPKKVNKPDKSAKKLQLSISVKSKVARRMAAELGAMILEAMDYCPEEETVVVEAPVEEPAIEEPVLEEPVLEEPVLEEPVLEEPVIEEPAAEEIAVEEAPAEETEAPAEEAEVEIPEAEAVEEADKAE